MQRILMLRGLVLTPEEDIEAWLQFASLCRVKKNYRIAKKVCRTCVYIHSQKRHCGIVFSLLVCFDCFKIQPVYVRCVFVLGRLLVCF